VADIVGTAFVTVRAITSGVKGDIRRGIDKGVKDSEAGNKRAGERIGRQLGDGIQVGLNKKMGQVGQSMAAGLNKQSDRTGRIVGERIGRRIGQEVSLQVRRVPIAPFLLTGLAPILAGGLKLIAAFVGSAISFLQPLGPAFTAATVSAGAGITTLGQAGLTMLLAWKAEGPVLDAFKERLKGIREEFFEVGKAVQGVLFTPLANSIERLTTNLLPLLRTGLVQTGRVLAGISVDFARLSGDPIFKAQFASILANNNVVLANLGKALVSVTSAATTLVAAGGPLLAFFSNYVRITASGWADTLRLAQETGRLTGFFERAQVTLQQLGRIGENVRIALSNTFRSAARESEHLWGRFEILTEKWRAFTESVRGQRVMDRFFAEASSVTSEVAGLFGDMFTMIGRGLVSSSAGLISFIRGIRFEVLPVVADMARSFAGLAPVITKTVVSIAQFFAQLAQTGVLSTFLSTISAVINVFDTLLSLPVVGWVTGAALSFLAMGKAINILTLGSFTRALAPLGGLLGGLAGRAATAATSIGFVGRAATGAKVALTGLGLSLGGVLGIALTGVTLALGFLAGKHAEAEAAAADQARIEQELAATLDTVTGSATRATREFIANELVSSGAAEAAKEYGIALQTVTEAASGDEAAMATVNERLVQLTDGAIQGSETWRVYGAGLEAAGVSTRDFAEALVQARAGNTAALEELLAGTDSAINSAHLLDEVNAQLGPGYDILTGQIAGTSGALSDAQDAMITAAEAAGPANERILSFNEAMATLNDTASSTDERLEAVKSALDALNPSATSVEETTGRLNEIIRNNSDALKDSQGHWLDVGNAIDVSTGKINTATEGGNALFQMLTEQSDAAIANAIAIRDKAEADGTLATSGKAILAPLTQARQAFIDQAHAAGASKEAAAAAWDTYAQAPELVSTLIQAEGIEDATTGVKDFSGLLAELDATQAIAEILGNDTDLATKLVANRGNLAAFDKILAEAGLRADDADARAKVAKVMDLLANLDAQNPTPKASLDPRILERERSRIVANLNRLHAMKPTPQVRAEISEFEAKKRRVDSQIAALNAARPTPRVRAEDQEFQGKAAAVQSKLRVIDSTAVTADINAQANTGAAEGALNYAARTRYSLILAQIRVTGRATGTTIAEGGILHPGGRLTTAASGLLARRQPMIARASSGPGILWAEPETENESYIPHSKRKRPRATDILAKTAKIFGYGLYQMAEGGMTNQTSSTGSTRVSTSSPSTWGDTYNINIDGPEVAFRAQELADAIEVRRRRERAVRARIPR
jgi:hypothetical protein